jgi:excisionase family DNA binding protein
MKTKPQSKLLQSPVGDQEFLTIATLAERLGVTERTVARWQHESRLPYVRIGQWVRFHWPTVSSHLLANYTTHGPTNLPLRLDRGEGCKGEVSTSSSSSSSSKSPSVRNAEPGTRNSELGTARSGGDR